MKRLFVVALLVLSFVFAAPSLAAPMTIDLDRMSLAEIDALLDVVTARRMEILGIEPYVGNRNTNKFHKADCSSVKSMKEKNKVPLSSREEALLREYEPCRICNP